MGEVRGWTVDEVLVHLIRATHEGDHGDEVRLSAGEGRDRIKTRRNRAILV